MRLAASSPELPDGFLAILTTAQLNPKPHQGVPTKNPAPHPALDERNSTVAIALRASLALNGVRQSERARYYGGALGRFTSADEPLADQHSEDPQSWNLYSYGRNNPLNGIDRDGRDWTVCGNGGAECAVVKDDNAFDQFSKSAGNYVAGGAYYDSDGNQIGTASWSRPVDPTAGNAVGFLNFSIGALASNYVFGAAETSVGVAAEAFSVWRAGRTAVKVGAEAAAESSSAESELGRGLLRQINLHRRRLADYVENPDAFDNKGFLKNASPELRQKIIQSRIMNLEGQIENFTKQLENLTKNAGK